jgi:acetylornithine deacetylase/succinyl-diaminopimelate desuccinylase-like protein
LGPVSGAGRHPRLLERVIDRRSAEEVLQRIRDDDVAELALHLANIESPRGSEGECAQAIFDWCAESGFQTRRVGLFDERFNVFAELPGDTRATALAFNAHIDTWMAREDFLIFRDPTRPVYHGGWREGDLLVGNPVGNDKGPMSAFLVAARAILEADVRLHGSLYLTMVPGEIGQDAVDEFQGTSYISKEVGARFLLNHMPRPTYAICAEATAFKMGWVEAGKAFFKVTVFGEEPVYTPFLERKGERSPNAIVRALPVLQRIEEWAVEYERLHRYECPGGTVVPRVNIGAIRSGDPTLIIQSPEVCFVYLDVRTVPGQRSELIAGELEQLLRDEGVEGRVEQFVNRPGYEAQGIEPLARAVGEAHSTEFGRPCEVADSPVCSMWRDHNVFNEMGIPSLTYGPAGIVGAGKFAMAIPDLVHAARVYALTALSVCG